jgi:hypothetical protein
MEWTEAVFVSFNEKGAGGAGSHGRQLEDSDIISLFATLAEAKTKLARKKLGGLILWIDPGWGGRGGRTCRTDDAVGLAAHRVFEAKKKSQKAELNARRAHKSNKRRAARSRGQGPAKRTRQCTAEERAKRDSQREISSLEQRLQQAQLKEKELASQLQTMQENSRQSEETYDAQLDHMHAQLQQLLKRNWRLAAQAEKLQQAKLKLVEEERVLHQQMDEYLDSHPTERKTRARKRAQQQTEARRESRHHERVVTIQAQLRVLARKSKAVAGKHKLRDQVSKLRRQCGRLKDEVDRLRVSYYRLIELEDNLASDDDLEEEQDEDWASDTDQYVVVG